MKSVECGFGSTVDGDEVCIDVGGVAGGGDECAIEDGLRPDGSLDLAHSPHRLLSLGIGPAPRRCEPGSDGIG